MINQAEKTLLFLEEEVVKRLFVRELVTLVAGTTSITLALIIGTAALSDWDFHLVEIARVVFHLAKLANVSVEDALDKGVNRTRQPSTGERQFH